MTQVVGPHQAAVPKPQEGFPSDVQYQSLYQPWQLPKMDSGQDWKSEIRELIISLQNRRFFPFFRRAGASARRARTTSHARQEGGVIFFAPLQSRETSAPLAGKTQIIIITDSFQRHHHHYLRKQLQAKLFFSATGNSSGRDRFLTGTVS